MERTECEEKIAKLAKRIRKVYKEYNPDGDYFTLCFFNDTVMFNNACYTEDENRPIDFWMEWKNDR